VTGDTNAEMRAYWNGDDSREWVTHPQRFDEMLAPFGAAVLERARLSNGHCSLDVGCGNGAMTIETAQRVAPDGAAVGVDLSEPMLRIARDRATQAAATGASFVVADAQVDDLGVPFDAIVSRFGIMFFEDPDAAFANLASALAPDGVVSFACWAPALENPWVAVPMAAIIEAVGPPPGGLPEPDQPGPFRYADPAALLDSLERAALVDAAAEKLETTVLVGGRGTLDEAQSFVENGGMMRAVLGDLSDEERARALTAVRASLEPYATDDGVRMGAAAWLVTARRP
jgi:SAM-dependent methyltransferase